MPNSELDIKVKDFFDANDLPIFEKISEELGNEVLT